MLAEISSNEHRFQSFSVGVLPTTDDKRREVFDGIALLAGHQEGYTLPPRYGHHVECFERLIQTVHQWMVDAPESFAQLFGEGEARYNSRFAAFVARLKKLDAPVDAGERNDRGA